MRGSRRAVLIDCGLGIVPLAPVVRDMLGSECPVVLTHGHLDHAGSAHEFEERWGHVRDERLDECSFCLESTVLAAQLGIAATEISSDSRWQVTKLPNPGLDPRLYVQKPARLTRRLEEGDSIDLGGVTLEVLHLPGHTPGSIALYERASRELYSGDVVYDSSLLDSLPESNRKTYRQSLLRLAELPIARVFPGHGTPFGGVRLRTIISEYLAAS